MSDVITGGGAANGADAATSKKPAREFESVTMADGRVVEFAGAPGAPRARRMLKESLFDDSGSWIGTRFDFRHGQTFVFDPFKLPPKFTDGTSSLGTLAAHGIEQKLGDETAGNKTGSEDMYLDVEALAERLYAGEWAKERVAGDSMAGTSILLQALVEQTGKPVDALKAWLKTKTRDEKEAMRSHPQSPLKPIVERLEAERLAKAGNIDIAAQFAQLDAIPGAPAA
jgi:hypothetical protein